MLKTCLLLISLVGTTARASTFFVPDSDTAALIALVTNTASTVTNTLKILSVARQTSAQIDYYNSVALRRYFIARRIEQHVRDLSETQKMGSHGLRELNLKLLSLKLSLQGLKSNIDFAAKDVAGAEDFVDRSWDKLANSANDEQEAHEQEVVSGSEGNMAKHVQNTAMNTALSAKILATTHRDQLDYQRIDLALKKNQQLEQLRKEQFYKDWLGVNQGIDPLASSGAEKNQ